ncbi:DNA-3-methyladenine glycosylase I [Aliikangiella coralliicola]|uniref:DNA-3-methyladenine glycosylase I n=1 Tax=Aliikangiella coralliicola TaxID=2592383 RepID=A0A545UFX5_9GAMM|nr:DNA-3-methyladenine glycosylase I [Aliikangiella coralliicola]TQV88368.1 DNA-3-methyladenine glycosylase I [Aliikangiella coralliicola]
MEKFSVIHKRAAKRKGGEEELQALMPDVKTPKQLSALPDREYLSAMAKKIFQSGFVWRVVENKWPGFNEVMWDFEPKKLSLASDEQIEKMAQDTRIIRNFTKVKAVRENAYFVKMLAKKHDGFGHFIADWPVDEITQLWLYLKKNGARLGGNTGPYFLRAVGKDTFLLTRDVSAYLIGQDIVSKRPSSQKDLAAVQSAFNEWQQQSGRSMAEISRIISCSIGENIINADH